MLHNDDNHNIIVWDLGLFRTYFKGFFVINLDVINDIGATRDTPRIGHIERFEWWKWSIYKTSNCKTRLL